MIEYGVVVALGLIVIFARLSWYAKVKMLSHPLALDITTFLLLYVLHAGTFSGVMVASVGALFCSITLSLGRKAFGYFQAGRYVPGWFNVEHKLQ